VVGERKRERKKEKERPDELLLDGFIMSIQVRGLFSPRGDLCYAEMDV